MKVKSLLAVLLALLLLAFAGCANKSADTSPQESYAYTEESVEAESASFGSEPGATAPNTGDTAAADGMIRKIVYDAAMELTADAPEAVANALREKAEALGGYLADSSSRTDDYGVRYASLTLRVPAERLDELLEVAENAGKIDYYNLGSQDITDSYYDVEARLAAAKAEEEQLLKMLELCETVEDMLLVREQLASVRSDIEAYEGKIRLWNNLVSYATLTVYINRTAMKAVETEDDTVEMFKASDVWKKIKSGFANSARWTVNALGYLAIFLAIVVIPGAIVAAVVILIVKLAKRRKRRRAQKKALTAAAQTAEKVE